tara:strand:- start:8409 stop:8594 length:186 start_codon:yes stop_codon:yes gene_type:complete
MEDKNLKKGLNDFLTDEDTEKLSEEHELDCSSGTCVVKNDKSIVERINKKIITEDGRQLLF